MAKKIVTVDENAVRGYMSDCIQDAMDIEENIIQTEAEEQPLIKEKEKEKSEPLQEKPKVRKKREDNFDYRERYLVNTTLSNRIQVYLDRTLYNQIKNYLSVIVPSMTIASYISNIIAEHIENNIEEIDRMYKERFSPPKLK